MQAGGTRKYVEDSQLLVQKQTLQLREESKAESA
jgi:hypothetical protein